MSLNMSLALEYPIPVLLEVQFHLIVVKFSGALSPDLRSSYPETQVVGCLFASDRTGDPLFAFSSAVPWKPRHPRTDSGGLP